MTLATFQESLKKNWVLYLILAVVLFFLFKKFASILLFLFLVFVAFALIGTIRARS
jgi:hypothetical protein